MDPHARFAVIVTGAMASIDGQLMPLPKPSAHTHAYNALYPPLELGRNFKSHSFKSRREASFASCLNSYGHTFLTLSCGLLVF